MQIFVLTKDEQKSLKRVPVSKKLILQLKEHAESFIFFGSETHCKEECKKHPLVSVKNGQRLYY